MLQEQGRFGEAEALFLEVLDRQLQAQFEAGAAATMDQLRTLYQEWERPQEAHAMLLRLLPLRRDLAEASMASAVTKGAFAWLLLTCEPADLQDAETALRFALETNEMTGHSRAGYLDTLALAYFRTGRVDEAVTTQQRAISLLATDAPDRVQYETRLAEFKATLEAGSVP